MGCAALANKNQTCSTKVLWSSPLGGFPLNAAAAYFSASLRDGGLENLIYFFRVLKNFRKPFKAELFGGVQGLARGSLELELGLGNWPIEAKRENRPQPHFDLLIFQSVIHQKKGQNGERKKNKLALCSPEVLKWQKGFFKWWTLGL